MPTEEAAPPVEHKTERKLRPRRIGAEDRVGEAWDACNAARRNVDDPRRVEKWSEAIESLYDALLPWTTGDEAFAKGWGDLPMAVVTLEDGTQVPMPTAGDCRMAHQLLTMAMHKHGLLIRERVVSGPGPRSFGKSTVEAPEVETA